MSDTNDHFRKKAEGDGPGLIMLDRPRPPAEPPRELEVTEDAGAQALSEALRSSFVIVKVLMAGLVVLFLCSGVFTVPSQQKAIILRFGEPVGTGEKMLLEPGLHWSWPYPIDEKIFIPLGQQSLRSTVGWYATAADGKTPLDESLSLNPAAQGYAITADANIIHVQAVLNYRITDPLQYALSFVNAPTAIQNALDSAIVYVSSRTTVTDALLERLRFQERILTRVRELVEQQGLGITLDVSTVEVVPPLGLKAKFEEVNSAHAQRGQIVQKASGDASRIITTAQGDATTLVNLAHAEAKATVEGARADAKYFLDQLQYYTNNPVLFTERLRTEALRRILTNAQDKYFLGRGAPLRILLNRDPQKSPPPQNVQP